MYACILIHKKQSFNLIYLRFYNLLPLNPPQTLSFESKFAQILFLTAFNELFLPAGSVPILSR